MERMNLAILGAGSVRCSVPVLPSPRARISARLGSILKDFESSGYVMRLQGNGVSIPLEHYYRLDCPKPRDADERRDLPHQALRWLRGEEYLFELFAEYPRSPL